MRNISKYIGVTTAACQLALIPSFTYARDVFSDESNQKKNVLMLVVDDWGAHDLSFTGSKFYETPNFDKLADKSVVFNQAYVAYPRSVPSRFSLFTGMHCARPQSESSKEADDRKIDENSYSIAEPFQADGYDTFFIGKWHLSTETVGPEQKGFNTNIGGGHAGAPSSYFPPYNKVRKNKHTVERPIENMDDALEDEYLTDYMSRKTVDYINSQSNEKPFFAVCSYYAVHTPLEAKADLIDKYKRKRQQLNLNDRSFIKEEAGERKAQQNNPVYAAMIESLDHGVGNIVDALKKKGLYDNTIIVLISDHGGLSNRGNQRELATTNAPLKAGKGHLYEGGVRVPLLIHVPGQKKKIESDAIVASYDLFPTLTALCSVPLKENATLDGVSLLPLLKNGKSSSFDNRSIYWHKAAERPKSTGDYLSSAIRKGDYKLIDFYQQNRIELYNIKNDPGEEVNLIETQPELASELLADLKNWKNEMKVRQPKVNKNKGVDQTRPLNKSNKLKRNKNAK